MINERKINTLIILFISILLSPQSPAGKKQPSPVQNTPLSSLAERAELIAKTETIIKAARLEKLMAFFKKDKLLEGVSGESLLTLVQEYTKKLEELYLLEEEFTELFRSAKKKKAYEKSIDRLSGKKQKQKQEKKELHAGLDQMATLEVQAITTISISYATFAGRLFSYLRCSTCYNPEFYTTLRLAFECSVSAIKYIQIQLDRHHFKEPSSQEVMREALQNELLTCNMLASTMMLLSPVEKESESFTIVAPNTLDVIKTNQQFLKKSTKEFVQLNKKHFTQCHFHSFFHKVCSHIILFSAYCSLNQHNAALNILKSLQDHSDEMYREQQESDSKTPTDETINEALKFFVKQQEQCILLGIEHHMLHATQQALRLSESLGNSIISSAKESERIQKTYTLLAGLLEWAEPISSLQPKVMDALDNVCDQLVTQMDILFKKTDTQLVKLDNELQAARSRSENKQKEKKKRQRNNHLHKLKQESQAQKPEEKHVTIKEPSLIEQAENRIDRGKLDEAKELLKVAISAPESSVQERIQACLKLGNLAAIPLNALAVCKSGNINLIRKITPQIDADQLPSAADHLLLKNHIIMQITNLKSIMECLGQVKHWHQQAIQFANNLDSADFLQLDRDSQDQLFSLGSEDPYNLDDYFEHARITAEIFQKKFRLVKKHIPHTNQHTKRTVPDLSSLKTAKEDYQKTLSTTKFSYCPEYINRRSLDRLYALGLIIPSEQTPISLQRLINSISEIDSSTLHTIGTDAFFKSLAKQNNIHISTIDVTRATPTFRDYFPEFLPDTDKLAAPSLKSLSDQPEWQHYCPIVLSHLNVLATKRKGDIPPFLLVGSTALSIQIAQLWGETPTRIIETHLSKDELYQSLRDKNWHLTPGDIDLIITNKIQAEGIISNLKAHLEETPFTSRSGNKLQPIDSETIRLPLYDIPDSYSKRLPICEGDTQLRFTIDFSWFEEEPPDEFMFNIVSVTTKEPEELSIPCVSIHGILVNAREELYALFRSSSSVYRKMRNRLIALAVLELAQPRLIAPTCALLAGILQQLNTYEPELNLDNLAADLIQHASTRKLILIKTASGWVFGHQKA